MLSVFITTLRMAGLDVAEGHDKVEFLDLMDRGKVPSDLDAELPHEIDALVKGARSGYAGIAFDDVDRRLGPSEKLKAVGLASVGGIWHASSPRVMAEGCGWCRH